MDHPKVARRLWPDALASGIVTGPTRPSAPASPPTAGARVPPAEGADLLGVIATATAGVAGTSFLRRLSEALVTALGAEAAFVAEIERERTEYARVVASFGRLGISLVEGSSFEIAITPCELCWSSDTVVLPEGACRLYPRDTLVAAHGLDSYVAVVIRGHDGTRLGHIGVMARHRLRPDEAELTALRIFAARAGAELDRRHQADLVQERERRLVASRVRLVRAADDERRRIGRNLHDGAQQQLVALGFTIDAVQRALSDDPHAVEELLQAAREQAAEASAQLRRLARGLHPHGLSEHGLEVALRRLTLTSSLPVELRIELDSRLPEALELALFYTVAESVTNVLKHARASRILVEVRRAGGHLLASIDDDGVGGAQASHAGSGLDGLTDRIEALGGTVAIESRRGHGTRVRVRLPLAEWRDAEA